MAYIFLKKFHRTITDLSISPHHHIHPHDVFAVFRKPKRQVRKNSLRSLIVFLLVFEFQDTGHVIEKLCIVGGMIPGERRKVQLPIHRNSETTVSRAPVGTIVAVDQYGAQWQVLQSRYLAKQ